MSILWIVALNKFVEVFALQWIGFQGEMFVGSEVVDPELLGPRRFTGRLLIEEEDVRFYALRIEQAGRQTQQGMDLALVQQLSANRLPCPALEKNIVRNHDRRPAVLLQQRFDVLEKIEILVRGRRPKIIALDNFRLTRHFAIV